MAVTYDICLQTKDQASHQHSGNQIDALQIKATTDYLVTVSDPVDSGFDPRTIMSTDVLDQPGLPEVAKTIWNFNGRTVPYLTCLNKQARRDEQNRGMFHVSCQWSTGTQNSNRGSQPPPVNLTDYNAQYEFSLTETEKQLWADLDDQEYISPSGSQYSEPLIEGEAQQVLKISQYEASITYAEMQNRMGATNSTTWRTDNPGIWKITNITASDVLVPLAGGDTLAAMVVMTVTQQTPDGWDARRACIDTHYLGTGSDTTTRKAFKDEDGETFDNGKIQAADGTQDLLPGEADIVTFRNHRQLDFNSFIQPEV